MQTRSDCMGKTAGLVGDPYFDWLTPEYFSPFCNTAYEQAIMYLEGSCSPFIEKVVVVPSVPVGQDENDLVVFASGVGNNKVYPLAQLVEPRFVDFKPAGTANNQYKPVTECQILPDTASQVSSGLFDIRVRGSFRPEPLTADDSIIEIHPLASHALAFSIGALIGMERPNEGWVENYGKQALNAWDQIAAKLVTQQQHLSFRLGAPNRQQNQRGPNFNINLQGNMGWEYRGFKLYVKLI
jgi:hypothetical protein